MLREVIRLVGEGFERLEEATCSFCGEEFEPDQSDADQRPLLFR